MDKEITAKKDVHLLSTRSYTVSTADQTLMDLSRRTLDKILNYNRSNAFLMSFIVSCRITPVASGVGFTEIWWFTYYSENLH